MQTPWAGLVLMVVTSGVALADVRDDRAAERLTPLGASVRRDAEGRITSIFLFPGASKVTDAEFACVAGLTSVRSMILVETHLTDAALGHLKTLPALTSLYLGGTHTDAEGVTRDGGAGLTDAGLKHLAGLRSLRNLSLGGSGFTDRGLVHLKGMTGLRSLALGSPSFSDAGLAELTGLVGLNDLSLAGSGVTGPGLARLDVLPALKSLVLGPNTFDAEGLKPLASLAALRSLMFYQAKLVGDAPARLATLTRLEQLTLTETPLPAGRIEMLRTSLPTTSVNVEEKEVVTTKLSPKG